MLAAGALGTQKSVSQDPAAQILVELFDHEVWQWVPQVVFNLSQEREPASLDELVKRRFFGFVALIVVGLRTWNRHREIRCLQMWWPLRIALLMIAWVLRSGTGLCLGNPVQRDQMSGPFGHALRPRQGRLCHGVHPLPFIHWFLDRN